MEAQRPTDATAASGKPSTTLTQRLVQLTQRARERAASDPVPATPTPAQPYTPRKGWGGRELARRRESIEDLYGLQLRFDKVRDGSRYQRVKISLFDIPEFSKEKDACYYVQFHPLVSRWLENYHTFISLSLRRKLSDLGKALHRFLASQRSNSVYRIDAIALYEAIGAQDRVWKLNQNTRKQLIIMQQEGFITSFLINGTGRSTPFVLHIVFPRKS